MSDLPKVVWTGPSNNDDGRDLRIVLVDEEEGFAQISIEQRNVDALGADKWDRIHPDSDDLDERSVALCAMDTAIADLSGVKWRQEVTE